MVKRNKLRIWGMIIALLFLGMFLLSKYALKKEEAIATMVNACTDNIPFMPTWKDDLAKEGFKAPTDWVAGAYCQCYFSDLFDGMSDDDVVNYTKMTPNERLTKISAEKMQNQHLSCMAKVKLQQDQPK